jgi:pentatricopeptide repeat protein
MCEKALDLFEKMSFKSNSIINTTIFNACAQLKNDRGKSIGYHLLDQILNKSETSEITMSSAIFMLMVYSDVTHAEQLFRMIQNKCTSTYASMMRTYNLNNQPLKTLKLFEEVKQQNIIPNEIVFVSLIGACAQIGILSICQSVVDQIPMSFYDKAYI